MDTTATDRFPHENSAATAPACHGSATAGHAVRGRLNAAVLRTSNAYGHLLLRRRKRRLFANLPPAVAVFFMAQFMQPGRMLRHGRARRLAADGTPVVLRDGSTVLIRPVRGTDAPLLADGFARLSPQSRRMRFLGTKTTLSAAELRYFTEVDHHDHEAIGALSAADGRGVGIARYVRDAGDPQAAEIAVTIVDDWQGRGLGTELLARLSDRARRAGIHRFTALAAAENIAVTALARKLGARLAGRGPGTAEYEVALVPAEYSLDWWFGCADGPTQPARDGR